MKDKIVTKEKMDKLAELLYPYWMDIENPDEHINELRNNETENNEVQRISIFKGKNGLWGAQIKLLNVVPFIYSNKEYVYQEIEHHAKKLGFKYTTEEI